MKARGYVVHSYADTRRDRLYLIGRLEDGRSFAAADGKWQLSLHIYERDREKAAHILSSMKIETLPPVLKDFYGRENLLLLKFIHYRDYNTAGKCLAEAGIASPDADLKPHDAYFIQKHIRGPVELDGETRPGRIVDLVFTDPDINPVDECNVNLVFASVDIETDVENGTILAIGTSVRPNGKSFVHVLSGSDNNSAGQLIHSPKEGIFFHPSESSMLRAFLEDICRLDPDVITGWNFLDFDYPQLAERCAYNHIPFTLGRSGEDSKYFPPSRDGESGGEAGRRRSAAALVQGRQVLDALRIFRSGPRGWAGGYDNSSFTLEKVANSVLGEGKLVTSSGEEKIAALKALYREDPLRFGEYCMRDAELVLRILEKTGLARLTVERASLTGVSLDKAWTSVVSFERIYGMELRRRLIAAPPPDPKRSVSGAAGGTVLDPMPGLFQNVAVFDFRSLYPTIILTFNIDPRSYALARAGIGGGGKGNIIAPNGAVFSGDKEILPELIAGYFAARQRALEAGDEEASFVYKILMNSFYGVMGTSSCRYGRTELAGAITSFARKWLYFTRDWFTQKGYRVLYGDTDSLFIESGLGDGASYEDFHEWGKRNTQEVNIAIKEKVMEEYDLDSYLELRFEKLYRRFMIPPLRAGDGTGRGRAKGYSGYLLDKNGGVSVEVKGMEAVRSDYTPLARRIQVELLEMVFSGCDETGFKTHVNKILHELRSGKLDGELLYRKRLSKAPEAYTRSTPPQVKAARALGWKNKRGTVEFFWTVNGPEPYAGGSGELHRSAIDYDHYAESQVLPAVRSIASAAGWNADMFPSPGRDFFRDGQMELDM